MLRASLQAYVRAEPFRPFRMVMNSGKTYDVRHPEMVKVLPDVCLYFYGTDPAEPERWESVSLVLIQNVEHLEQPAAPAAGDGAGS